MIALKIIGVIIASILGLTILALAAFGLFIILCAVSNAKHEAKLWERDR